MEYCVVKSKLHTLFQFVYLHIIDFYRKSLEEMRERSQPNMSALFEKHMAVTNRVFRKCVNKKKQILYFLFGHLFFRQP